MTVADVAAAGEMPPVVAVRSPSSLSLEDRALLEPLRAGIQSAREESTPEQIGRFLAFRGTSDSEVIELQTLPHTAVKYAAPMALRTARWRNIGERIALEDRTTFDGLVIGAFYVMNAINPDIVARSAADCWNSVPKGEGTKDADIIERRVLYFDHDPIRPSGISANEDERAAALLAAESTYLMLARLLPDDLLSALGFGDSGNGYHVHLAIKCAADLVTERTVKALLLAVDALVSTDKVKIDTSVGDAKRLCPAYGTMKRKGVDTAARPHRRTAFWGSRCPARLELEDLTLLVGALCDLIGDPDLVSKIRHLLVPEQQKLTRPSTHNRPPETKRHAAGARSGENLFERTKALDVREVATRLGLYDGQTLTCPGCESGAGVDFFQNGVKCFHDRCVEKGKSGFRTTVDLAMEVYCIGALEAALKLAEEFGLPTSASSADERPWEDPVPLTPPRCAEPFPVDALPAWMAAWIKAEAMETQTPLCLAAMLSLVGCALAVAKKFIVHVKGDWYEPVNLYCVAVMSPGNRKSAVFAHATRPIKAEQKRLEALAAPSIERAKRENEVHERQKKLLLREINQTNEQVDEARKKYAELPAAPAIPTFPRLVADDTTPEAIVRLLSENDGRIGVLSSEGGILTTLAGAYSDKVNIDVFLKGHGSEDIVVDRIGRPHLSVSSATITFGLTIQPTVLQELVENDSFRGRGLTARFLYFFPEDVLGHREVDAPVMAPSTREAFEQEVQRLLELPRANDDKGGASQATLELSADAQLVRADYERNVEYRLGEDGNLRHMTDWGGKVMGAVIRIAGLLHLASGTPGKEIQISSMLAATRIGEYLIEHARAAYASAGESADEGKAGRVLQWLARGGHTTFSKRDAFNGLRAHFKQARELDPVLELLVDKKYIRDASPPYAGRGQPKSPKFEVNPYWLSQKTQKVQKVS